MPNLTAVLSNFCGACFVIFQCFIGKKKMSCEENVVEINCCNSFCLQKEFALMRLVPATPDFFQKKKKKERKCDNGPFLHFQFLFLFIFSGIFRICGNKLHDYCSIKCIFRRIFSLLVVCNIKLSWHIKFLGIRFKTVKTLF